MLEKCNIVDKKTNAFRQNEFKQNTMKKVQPTEYNKKRKRRKQTRLLRREDH